MGDGPHDWKMFDRAFKSQLKHYRILKKKKKNTEIFIQIIICIVSAYFNYV